MNDPINIIRIFLIAVGGAIIFWRTGNRAIRALVGTSFMVASSLVDWALQFVDTLLPPTTLQVVSLISIVIMLTAALWHWSKRVK